VSCGGDDFRFHSSLSFDLSGPSPSAHSIRKKVGAKRKGVAGGNALIRYSIVPRVLLAVMKQEK